LPSDWGEAGLLARIPWTSRSIKALESAKLAYRVTFTNPHYYAQIAAVSAGIDVIATSRRHMEKSLVIGGELSATALTGAGRVLLTAWRFVCEGR